MQPCSIEALFSRIAKGSNVPHINALVDLNNAISLKTTLPLGTHDLGDMTKDITIRRAKETVTTLSDLLKKYFDCETVCGFMDKEHPEMMF